MGDPEQKTAFYNEVAKKLLEFQDALERDNYLEAVSREHFINYQDLKQLVNRLGSRLDMTVKRPEREEAPERKKKEKDDGSRITGNPFADNVVMFSESKVLGSTYWKKPADMNLKGSVAIKAMNGHTCVKKYSTEEPIEEVTVGIANAFPAWLSSGRSFLMDTSNSTWTH